MKVRDVIRRLTQDGWYQVGQEGSHRQFKHPTKRGRVTVAGHLPEEVPPGTLASIFRQAGLTKEYAAVRYLIVLERGHEGYGAYAPDLPGCVAVGPTPEETLGRMQKAIEMHLRGLREDGEPVPEPTAQAEWLVVA